MATPIDVVVLKCRKKNFRREIGEIVLFTSHIHTHKNFSSLPNCRYCTDRAQNLSWSAPNV